MSSAKIEVNNLSTDLDINGNSYIDDSTQISLEPLEEELLSEKPLTLNVLCRAEIPDDENTDGESCREKEFKQKLTDLINCFGYDNILNTPDFILADYMFRNLEAVKMLNIRRDGHFNREPKEPQTEI